MIINKSPAGPSATVYIFRIASGDKVDSVIVRVNKLDIPILTLHHYEKAILRHFEIEYDDQSMKLEFIPVKFKYPNSTAIETDEDNKPAPYQPIDNIMHDNDKVLVIKSQIITLISIDKSIIA